MVLYGGVYKIFSKKQDWIMVNPIFRSPLYERERHNFFAPNQLHRNGLLLTNDTKIDDKNM